MEFHEYLEEVDRYATSPVAKNCISSLFNCFEKNNVDLGSLIKFNSSVALRRGFPFSFINPEAYDDEILSKVCVEYSKNNKFNENDFAEVAAIALLIALNVDSIVPLKRSHQKSYDFDVVWNENDIEVEVTRPGEKDDWSERVSQSQTLASYSEKLKREFTIYIYLVGILTPSEHAMVEEIISNLKEGQKQEELGKWLIFSEKPSGDPTIIIEDKKDEKRPSWWPVNVLNGFSVSGMMAGAGQTEPLPRTFVKFSCPFDGYINRAKKKATKFQGTRTKPFVLILDANELGAPFPEFKKNLDYYFVKWDQITAVLIFTDYYTTHEIGWEIQAFINPHAKIKFDTKTQEMLLKYTDRYTIVKHYA